MPFKFNLKKTTEVPIKKDSEDKSTARNWCFTWNNYSDDDIASLKNYQSDYLIFGKEVGKSNTPHLQGYIEFSSPKEFKTLHNNFPKIHWEKRKGNQQQAIDYCKKEGDVYEQGTAKKQGKRSDLVKVANAVVDGSFKPDDYPEEYIKFNKGIEAFKSSLLKDRTEKPIVIWRWGESGVGKTRIPFEKHIHSVYIKDSTVWWNGYEQQEAIIIDDYNGKWEFRDLLRLLDRYPYQAQYKGGYIKVNSPYIYITCEFPPDHFYQGNALLQMSRRLTDVIHVTSSMIEPSEILTTNVNTLVAGNTIPPPKFSGKCLI